MAIKKTTQTYSDLTGDILAKSSLLNMFNVMIDNGEYFLNIFKTFTVDPNILNDQTNTETVNVIEPWWENISNTYYNDVDLWWVSPLMNDVMNPYEELDGGDTITMLKKVYVPYIHRDMKRIFDL
jgi:hypothetical protein